MINGFSKASQPNRISPLFSIYNNGFDASEREERITSNQMDKSDRNVCNIYNYNFSLFQNKRQLIVIIFTTDIATDE